MRSTLTILGLYNYDNSIFDNLITPPGISMDSVTENILVELGEIEVLFASAPFMKMAIGIWARKNYMVWEKMYNTTILDYNPIENYDRIEDFTDTETRNLSASLTGNDSTVTNSNSTDTVAGFNSASLVDSAGNLTTGKQDNTAVSNTTDTGTVGSVHSGRTHGNIGVTTTQQMLEQERNIVKFNVIDYIIDDFKNRFCILVY